MNDIKMNRIGNSHEKCESWQRANEKHLTFPYYMLGCMHHENCRTDQRITKRKCMRKMKSKNRICHPFEMHKSVHECTFLKTFQHSIRVWCVANNNKNHWMLHVYVCCIDAVWIWLLHVIKHEIDMIALNFNFIYVRWCILECIQIEFSSICFQHLQQLCAIFCLYNLLYCTCVRGSKMDQQPNEMLKFNRNLKFVYIRFAFQLLAFYFYAHEPHLCKYSLLINNFLCVIFPFVSL